MKMIDIKNPIRKIAICFVLIGLIVFFVAVFADSVGLGQAGIGAKQILSVFVSCLIIAFGLIFSTNKASSWLIAQLRLPLLDYLQKGFLIFWGCFLSIVILEIGLRIFWNPELTSWQKNIQIVLPLDSKITRNVIGPARIITNSRGIRGQEFSDNRKNEYRILAIGGSTTECLAQDQPNTWTALLQTKMPFTPNGRSIWVGNAGHGGHDSRHHVLAMRFMLDQYNPDTVIILMGANDAGICLSFGQKFDPWFINNDSKMQELSLDFYERPVSLMKNFENIFFQNFYLWLFMSEYSRHFFTPQKGFVQNIKTYGELQEKRRHAWLVVDNIPDIHHCLQGYENNILELIKISRAYKIHLVFMTQPALYKDEMSSEEINSLWAGWLGPRDLNVYWSPRVWKYVIDAHNKLLLDICMKQEIDCIDLASILPKTKEIFWDQCHFTDYGSALIADELVKYFTKYFNRANK